MKKISWKKIIIILSIILLVIFLSLLSVYFYFGKHKSRSTFIVGPVQSKIKISWNKNEIPKIHVNDYSSLYFSFGYLHATDRAKFVEYLRAIAIGKATFVSKDLVLLDKISKRIGFLKKAKFIEKKLSSKEKEKLTSYIQGINFARHQFLHSKILQRDWNIQDVISILLLKEWANAFLNNKELFFQFENKKFNPFLNSILPEDYTFFYTKEERKYIHYLNTLKAMISKYIGFFNRGYATNFINDKNNVFLSEREFNPSFKDGWYPIQVDFNGKEMFVQTFSSMPFIFSKRGSDFSYEMFSLNVDTQSFVIEKIKKDQNDKLKFLGRRGWQEFTSKGDNLSPTGVILKKNETDAGPVLNDIFCTDEPGKNILSLKFSLFDESYVSLLLSLPFEKSNVDAKLKIVATKSLPSIFLLSDKNGIEKVLNGEFYPSSLVNKNVFKNINLTSNQKVSLNYYFVPNIDGIIGSSFKNSLPGFLQPYMLTDNIRFKRLIELIKAKNELAVVDVQKILLDKFSSNAERFFPIFKELLQNNPVTSARLTRIYFSNWNFSMDSKMVAPVLYHSILKNFIFETLKDEFGNQSEQLKLYYPLLVNNFYDICKKMISPLFDDINTSEVEKVNSIFDKSFMITTRNLSRKFSPYMDRWYWGVVSKINKKTLFSTNEIIKSLTGTKKENVLVGGGNNTLFKKQVAFNNTPIAETGVLLLFWNHKGQEIKNNKLTDLNFDKPFCETTISPK